MAAGALEQIPKHVLPETLISRAQDNLRNKALDLADNSGAKGDLLPDSQAQLTSVAGMAARHGDLDLLGPYFRDGERVPI